MAGRRMEDLLSWIVSKALTEFLKKWRLTFLLLVLCLRFLLSQGQDRSEVFIDNLASEL